MAVNPDKNIVEQSLIARLIGKIKRISLDISDDVSAEETRAMAAEASARTEVVHGENCSVTKTTAADGHDVYTVNADGKPQVQSDWNQSDSSETDYIKNKPNLNLKADKVQGATAGNLAALDATGNLADSGKSSEDFASAAQGNKADSAIQSISVNGGTQQPDANMNVNIGVPTGYSSVPKMDGTGYAGVSAYWAHGDHVHPSDTSREDVSNKKQSIDPTSTTEYASSKAVADFVNSSIATNTANFLGTIAESSIGLDYTATNEQIELALNVHSWESTPTNNDYCFVSVNDPQTTDVDEYRRFKFNDKTNLWRYEYTLNNSSFTQAQWDAINSGLTSSDRTAYNAAVTLLNSHVGDGSIHVTAEQKSSWTAKQNAVTTDTDENAFDDNTTIATGFGSDKVHLNLASRLWTYISGKVFSDNGKVPSNNIPDSIKSKVVYIDATVNTQTNVVTCSTTRPELQAFLDAGKIPVIRMVESNGTRRWTMWYHGSQTGEYKFASTDNAYGNVTGQGCLGYITSVRLKGSGDNWWWDYFNDNTFYDTEYADDRFLSKATFRSHYGKSIELPVGLQYTRIAYIPEVTEGDIRSVFDIALWDGLNSTPQELRFEVFINADHTEIQIKPLKFIRGYNPYGTYYFDYTGKGIGKIYVKYENSRFSIYVGLKAVVPSGITVSAYIQCYDLMWIPVSTATAVTEPTGATSIDVIGDHSNVYIYYTDDAGSHGEKLSTIAELDYALSVGNKTILLYDSEYDAGDNNYYQYAGKYTDSNHTNWYRFEGGIIEDSGFFGRKIVDVRTTDGQIQRKTINIPACNSSGVVDITNVPTTSSVTNDATKVPTSHAVYNALAGKASATPTFSEASDRNNLNGSNESMTTILGKIKKWFTDLGGGSSNANKVWKTDSSGTPAWRDDANTTYSQISRGSSAGLAPGLPSGSGTTKYLREDGTWQVPPDNNTTYSQISRGSSAGLAPGLPSGSGTTKYLREDGTWQVPPDTDKSDKTTVVKQISRGADFDPITSGYFAGMTTKSGISGDWWHILSMDWKGNDSDNWISQLALPTDSRNGLYYRTRHNRTSNDWVKCLDTSNYTSYVGVTAMTWNSTNNQLQYTKNSANYNITIAYATTAGDVTSQSKLNTVGYVRSILYRKSANFDIPLTGLREGDLVIVFCTKSSGSITVTYGGGTTVVGATTVAAGRFRIYCYVNSSTGLIASES